MLPNRGTIQFQERLDELLNKEDTRWEGYSNAVEHCEEMSVHVWGNKPSKLLNRLRPREDDETKDYRISSFEPVTKSKSDKAISILHKIFSEKLWSIEWKETPASQALEDYCTKKYPIFRHVVNYIKDVVLKKMLADPNGVIGIVPYAKPMDESEMVEPVAKIFSSKMVLDFIPEEYYVILSEETYVAPKYPRELHFIHIFDRDGIWTYAEVPAKNQAGRYSDFVFDPSRSYEHQLGYVPVWQLGGNVDGRMDHLLFESYFSACVPYWNKAINAESDLDGAYQQHMHPIRIELAEECQFSFEDGGACNAGTIFGGEKDGAKCPGCGGTGQQKVNSPYRVYQRKADPLNPEANALPPVEYVTIPTEPTELLEARKQLYIKEGLAAINMEIVNEIGENQSGIAKEIDRSELHSFMLQISDYIYGVHLQRMIFFIGMYRNFGMGKDEFMESVMPQIVKPKQFDTTTIREGVDRIKTAKDGGLSSAYIQGLQIDQNNKEFNNNPEMLKRVNAMTKLNPHPEKDVDEIVSAMEAGTITRDSAIIALNIESFIYRAFAEQPAFDTMGYIEQGLVLIGYAQEIPVEESFEDIPEEPEDDA